MRAQTIGIALLVLLGAWIVKRDTPRVVLGRESKPLQSAVTPHVESPHITTPIGEKGNRAPQFGPAASNESRLESVREDSGPRNEFHGIALDTDGSPCEGAVVRFQSVPSSHVSARSTEPVFEIQSETVTDAFGRFAFESPNESTRRCSIRLERPGRAPVEWSLQSAPGRSSLFDLQAVRLERTAWVRGLVVGRDGSPLERGWTIHARRLNVPNGMYRVAASQVARPGEGLLRSRSGRFELTALAPGTYELVTRFVDGIVQRGPKFEIDAGEDRSVEVRRKGPNLDAAVLCALRSTRALPYDLQADEFVLRDSNGRTHPLLLRDSMLAAYDLEDDAYVLEARTDRYRPAQLRGLRPGGLARTMKLEGTGSLQLDVRSALTGEVIEAPWVQLRFGGPSPAIHTLQSAWEPIQSSLLFPDLALPLRTPTTLLVGAEGWVADSTIELDVKPGQSSRTVEVRLRPGTWIEGRAVVRGSSRPFIGDLDIYVHELSQDGENWRSAPTAVLPCPARGDGRFVLEALPHGRLLLEARSARGGGAFHGSAIAPALAADTQATPLGIRRVRIELEEPGYATVALFGFPSGSNAAREFEGYVLEFVHPRGMSASGSLAGNVFSAGPLQPGPWQLELRSRGEAQPVRLAKLQVAPGRHDYEVRPALPARVQAEVRVDGSPLAGATLRLASPEAEWIASSRLDGLAPFGLVAPGTYEIWIEGPSTEPWVQRLPGHLFVEASATLTRAVDLHRVPGEILLIDGPTANEPLREALVTLSWRGQAGWRECEKRTDSRGILRAEFPPGSTFVLSRGGEAAARRDQALPTIEWTRRGASRSVVRLPY